MNVLKASVLAVLPWVSGFLGRCLAMKKDSQSFAWKVQYGPNGTPIFLKWVAERLGTRMANFYKVACDERDNGRDNDNEAIWLGLHDCGFNLASRIPG